ncbi:hypothetical protein STEG23_015013 [Scotinomys teguina]
MEISKDVPKHTKSKTNMYSSYTIPGREIAAFFPDFGEQRWCEDVEPQLRRGPVHYPEEGIHCAAEIGDPKPA